MATGTKSRTRREPNPATEERKAEVELLAEQVNNEAPDFRLFLARWGDRYSVSNLTRLWVQCPGATALHKLPTWRGMGRKVRAGEKAIWLRHPCVSHDPEKISTDNPTGEVFHGAPWMALFDYSQTMADDGFVDGADTPDANPDDVAEVKRLRMAACKVHPDVGGTDEEFRAAWARYETARDRLKAA